MFDSRCRPVRALLPSPRRRTVLCLLLGLVGGVATDRVTAQVQSGDREGVPVRQDRVERHGITWHFDREYPVGSFANGDPWVVGPVAIVRIEPESVEARGRVRHGSMIDPDATSMLQGYDSALFGEEQGKRYRERLNVAWRLGPERPLQLVTGTSLVSVQSRDEVNTPPTLETAAVLTCVGEAPAPDAFRPPYVAGEKRMPHRAADLDVGVLQRLPPVGDATAIATVAAGFERLWLDHFPEWPVRFAHPRANMPDYGRDIGALVGTAGLLLNLDLPDVDKRDLLVRVVQLGLDQHAALRAGCRRQGIGGHGHGRKLPILIAGLTLHDDLMLAIGRDFVSKTAAEGGKGGYFGEDTQTFYVTETATGVWNWGHGGYTREQDGLPEWGFSHADHPERDDARWDANPYRRCCTANAWLGQALAARVMGLREAWHHDAFFDYVDRYQQVEHQEAWHRAWVGWQAEMWNAYRGDY